MRALLALILISMCGTAAAVNVTTSDLAGEAQPKAWHILIDASHSLAARDSADSIIPNEPDQYALTEFTIFFDYRLNDKHTLRLRNDPVKRYDITQDQPEWAASETLLSHFWTSPWTLGPFGIRLNTNVQLPTSEEAQDNNKILAVSETVQLNATFFGKYTLSARPYARYNWYEFNTTKSGFLLPVLVYGLNLINTYQFNDAWSLNVSVGYSFVQQSASQYDPNTNFGYLAENADGRYLAAISLNYSMSDKIGVYAGVSSGDTYIKDGRYELYAYDPELSRYSVGATVYF